MLEEIPAEPAWREEPRNAGIPRAARSLGLAIVVAACLLAWRRETLCLPPFQDQAVGYWAEASYLAESNFDYYSLLYKENHYMDDVSGPRSYMISVLPTLLAALMKVAPDADAVVVVFRLLSFLMGAGILVAVFRQLQREMPSVDAGLVCAALATTPAFITQIEIMGMDVPLALTFLFAFECLRTDRFVMAGLWSFLAFLIKATGQLMTLTAATYAVILLLSGTARLSREQKVRCRRAVAFYIALFLAETGLIAWGDTSVKYLAVDSWPYIFKPLYSLPALTPDVGVVLAAVLPISIVRLLRAMSQGTSEPGEPVIRRVQSAIFEGIRRERALFISWILICGLLASASLYIYTPRYVFCALPFLFFSLGAVLSSPSSIRWLARSAVVALIAVNLWNADGRLFPSIPPYGESVFAEIPGLTARSCAFVERSREYLLDHRSTIAAIDLIQKKYGDHPVFAAVPHLFFLRDPRLGYMRRSMRILDASNFTIAVANFTDVYLAQPGRPEPPTPIFFVFAHSRVCVPTITPQDRVIYKDELEPPLILYLKHVPGEVRTDRMKLEDWYIEQTWTESFVPSRVRDRLAFLLKTQRFKRIRFELDDALKLRPDDLELREFQGILEQVEKAASARSR